MNTEPTPFIEPGAPATPEDLAKEQLIESKMNLGKNALILTEVDKTDRDNIVNEAVERKLSKSFVARLPIVGAILKPGFAAYYRAKAIGRVDETGNTSSVYKVLGLEQDEKAKNANMESYENLQARARLAIEDFAAFVAKDPSLQDKTTIEDDNTIALNKGESISKLEGDTKNDVEDALINLFTKLKNANGDKKLVKTARDNFDQQLTDWQKQGFFEQNQQSGGFLKTWGARFLIGDHAKTTSTAMDSLIQAADNIETLANEADRKSVV